MKPLNNVIEVENLNVDLAGQNIIRNISLKISEGEIAAIIGPNGAGKTTFLKALLGMVVYTGKVTILGHRVKNVLDQIGYVPQHFMFDKTFPLTITEFLNLSVDRTKKFRIDEVLRDVEMNRQRNKLLGNLSGGQMQRVLIARALLNQPRILFLDEPTTGVDLEGEKSFYEIVEQQNREKQVTVVLISHEINMVYKYATQVVCLNRDLVCNGIPKEAITKEILDKLYSEDVEMRSHHH